MEVISAITSETILITELLLYAVTGTCLPMFGKKEGEDCYMDSDCETGYVCEVFEGNRQCMEPRPGVAKFGKNFD